MIKQPLLYKVQEPSKRQVIKVSFSSLRDEGLTIHNKGIHFLLDKFYKEGGEKPGGYSQKNLVVVCGPHPKTFTVFMTKICDFPYPIYDLTKNLIPYL